MIKLIKFLTFYTFIFVFISMSFSQAAGLPCKINVDSLNQTIVTPYLEYPIDTVNNVLWCATFQLAWNEMCLLNGEDIHFKNEVPMVTYLNKKLIRRQDLPEESIVAMAGQMKDGILGQIKDAWLLKFHEHEAPELDMEYSFLPPDALIVYSYMSRNLPFQWAFERMGINFCDKSVQSFGISQYIRDEEGEEKAASQLEIYDFRNADDFIIKLRTIQEDDELILAKLPPQKTLLETILLVQQRIKNSEPKHIEWLKDLNIPVLNFDLIRNYNELNSNTIVSNNPLLNNNKLDIARQRIKFKLDETGAVIKSEVDYAIFGIEDDNLIFDKPFLLMIKQKHFDLPYFVLWVSNAELLVPYEFGSL